MLTGDKLDTALSVGYTCGLVNEDSKVLRVIREEIEEQGKGFGDENAVGKQTDEEEIKDRLIKREI
jgi:magnesium-transporting ATPase (P-type)